MKKVIYFGIEEDLWWHTRFKEFIESLDQIEVLLKNDFDLYDEALKLPLLYYSSKHDVVIKYERELIYRDLDYPGSSDSLPLLRAKVSLFGKIERDIEDL